MVSTEESKILGLWFSVNKDCDYDNVIVFWNYLEFDDLHVAKNRDPHRNGQNPNRHDEVPSHFSWSPLLLVVKIILAVMKVEKEVQKVDSISDW